MAEKDKNLERFSRILNVYNEINLDKMAKLIGFKNSIILEQWILDLPEKYHSYLTIRGKDVIIQSNISEMIDDLLNEFEKWDTRKSEKIIERIDLRRELYRTTPKTESSILGDSKLGSAGKKFHNLLSTHKSIKRNQFIKVFELEAIADLDDWLLSLPKELGVFLNVKDNLIKFEMKASTKAKLRLAEHFNDWISGLMNELTKVDESAVDKEIKRIPSILGEGYHNYFKMDIKKENRKFLILYLTGENQFTTKSDYGDRTYTAFTVSKEVKERVSDFQPDIIEKAKKSAIQREINQRNGNRYYYVSPAGRNISRSIRTSEKDFQISLRNLLIEVVAVENFSFSILSPLKKQNILHISSPRKMCVKCGNIFTPVIWDGWEIKYLSTKKVFICKGCNPKLKKTVQEEKDNRLTYELKIGRIDSKKSKIRIFSVLNLILLLAIGLPLLSYIFPIIIFTILEVYLLIKWKLISNQIKNMRTEESIRKKVVLNSVKQYDGNLLKKKYIPEFCKRCRWYSDDNQKCHVDEEAGEIYSDFNLNGENECFEPRKNENIKGYVLENKTRKQTKIYDEKNKKNLRQIRDSNFWYNKGIAYRKSGDFQKAIECFEAVLRINPQKYEAREYIRLLKKQMRKLNEK